MERAVARRETSIIANHNLHSLYLHKTDLRMQRFYRHAGCVHIDGMAIVLLAKLSGFSVTRNERVTYVDWVPHIMRMAIGRAWRLFYLGSKPGVAELAADRLRKQYPGLHIETAHGYFPAERCSPENRDILDRLRAYKPHILLVGMGMPRQEHWILDNLDDLSGTTILTVGAAFDYYAGAVAVPPRWAGRIGLEWLFRLVAEPRRLWKRYLVEPWLLLAILISSLRKNSQQAAGP
ncbi:MAG: WecB/TagA/CpsF family glycosyltransferase [Bryobacteraceae bacterium]